MSTIYKKAFGQKLPTSFCLGLFLVVFISPTTLAVDLSNYSWGASPSTHFIINDPTHVLDTTPFYTNGSGSCEHRGAHIAFQRPPAGSVVYVDVFSPVDGTVNYPPANPSMGTIPTPNGTVDCGVISSGGDQLPKVNISIEFLDANSDPVNFLMSLETQSVNATCNQIELFFDDTSPSIQAGQLLARLPIIGDTHPNDREPHIHFNLTINGYSGQFCPNIFSLDIANIFMTEHDWPTSGHCATYPAPSHPKDAFCYTLPGAEDLTGN